MGCRHGVAVCQRRHPMRSWAILLSCALLRGCASAPPPAPLNRQMLADSAFEPPSERIDAADVFALSDAMRHYLRTDNARQLRIEGRQRRLIDALYQHNQLKLDYDASITRTAAQAFDARAGNCLSLVIMTAAFAKELGVQVTFQSAWT